MEREKARRKAEAFERSEAERLRQVEARKRELELQKERAELKAAQERKRQEELAKAKAADAQAERRLTAQREENLRRMMAGATGAPSATGTALQSTGPSPSYAGRIAARIKPNIVFSDVISGNAAAEVQIRVAPDGTIVGRKLIKSSGVKSWDEAVLRAIDKTEVLPRDVDGRVVPEFLIAFRPRD